MENIHKVIYINLDKRKDRKEEIENELKKLKIPSSKIERFSGIVDPRGGAFGCTLSHISILKRARDEKFPNILILEDDFCSNVDANKWESKLKDVFSEVTEYDVISFSHAYCASKPCDKKSVGRTVSSQTASGYLVHSNFYDALISNLEESYTNLTNNPHQYYIYALDQYWKYLQPSAKWFHIIPALGKQRPSFSDIENGFVNYET